MKACRWYQLEFPASLSGELRVEQEERVQDHVEACPECRGELDQFRMIDVLLTAGLPEPGRVRQFQQGFLERFEAEVAREQGARRSRFARLLQPASLLQPALLPLAAAAGVAGFLVWNTPVDAPGVVPTVPAVVADAGVTADADSTAGTAVGTAPVEHEAPLTSETGALPAVAEVTAQQDALLDPEPGLLVDYAVVRDFEDVEVAALVPDGNG